MLNKLETKGNVVEFLIRIRNLLLVSSSSRQVGRVLVVDDEPMVREVVTRYLERDGFRVDATGDGLTALELARTRPPDLLILDVMLPSKDGFSVLQELRKTSSVPVILLTARTDETDRVLGLELGADDYVVKPFSPRELSARVRSVLRRTNPEQPVTRLEFEGLTIEPKTREVKVGDELVDLTPREFEVLAFSGLPSASGVLARSASPTGVGLVCRVARSGHCDRAHAPFANQTRRPTPKIPAGY